MDVNYGAGMMWVREGSNGGLLWTQ